MHSKFIVSDGVVAAVLVINALADAHLGDAILGLRSGGGQFCIQNIIRTKEIHTKE
jgi:hypothetical protein